MARPRSYFSITSHDSGNVIDEGDTVTCGHCNGIIPVAPGQTDTDSCLACDSHICVSCANRVRITLKCVPFEKKIEALEQRDRLFREAIGRG